MLLAGTYLKDIDIQSYKRSVLTLMGLVGVLFSILPWLLWDRLWRLPIELCTEADYVNYRFKEKEYADEFFEINYPVEDAPDFS